MESDGISPPSDNLSKLVFMALFFTENGSKKIKKKFEFRLSSTSHQPALGIWKVINPPAPRPAPIHSKLIKN